MMKNGIRLVKEEKAPSASGMLKKRAAKLTEAKKRLKKRNKVEQTKKNKTAKTQKGKSYPQRNSDMTTEQGSHTQQSLGGTTKDKLHSHNERSLDNTTKQRSHPQRQNLSSVKKQGSHRHQQPGRRRLPGVDFKNKEKGYIKSQK